MTLGFENVRKERQCVCYENKVVLFYYKIFINVEYGHEKY